MEVAGLILIVIGTFFDLFGTIGLLRLPDVYNRLQASTKCVTMGTCLILFGFAVYSGFSPAGIKALICMFFILITSPTAAHALAKGSYRAGVQLANQSVCDLYSDKQVLKISAVMNRDVITILPDASLRQAIDLLVEKGITGLPVVDSEGVLLGIITEKDIIEYKTHGNVETAKVRDAMNINVQTLPPSAPLKELVSIFSQRGFRRVPIVEDGRVVGIVSRKDIIKFLKEEKK